MDPFLLGIIGIIVTLVLIIFRFPIAFVLAGVGTFGIIGVYGLEPALAYIPHQLYSHISKFTFTAVPLFLLMGYFAFYAGLTLEAYDAARAWVGKLPGGLALTTVGGCALFAASAGSSLAECAAMSKIAVPEMRRSGYSVRLATGVVASAGGMAVVIPPSIIMIIYGVITETSIGELLIAGILPGILYFGVFSVAIVLYAYFRPSAAPKETGADTSWKARRASVKKIWGIVALFTVVIGGIYGGLVTPTEAAALGAVGSIVLAYIKRKLNREIFKTALIETVKATAMIFLLLGGASIFTLFMSATGVITSATSGLIGLDLSPLWLLISLFVLYIILGMFLDSISMMILTLPLVLPILKAQDISIIWFGVIMCMIVEIGCITPPMGLNVYVMKGALGKSVDLNDIFAGALPFVLLMILIVVILYFFPQLALWLPSLMIQK
ncbi:MAG: TRAP transporter large permease [Deltaproteobacteria bacterium]|nr:TRAP transporter large permease [Deltaproteobacteria bacterium]